jgi:hypothetical protein
MAFDALLKTRLCFAHAPPHGVVALVLEHLHVFAAHALRFRDALLPARLLDHGLGRAPTRVRGRSRETQGPTDEHQRAPHRYSPIPIWM